LGLSLSVGVLADLLVNDEEGARWFEEDIVKLNTLLVANGLKPHAEPRALAERSGFSCAMWGYSGLHTLRRVAIHLAPRKTLLGRREGKLPPPSADEATEDPLLKAIYESATAYKTAPFPHLIIHGDAEGFYVPQDFPSVLVSDTAPGGCVGSVQRLRAECEVLAKALGLPAGLDPDSDEVTDAAEAQDLNAAGWKAYGVETYSCLQLMAACEASMKTGALLVFQ
jgi:hypothetical protein